MDAMQELQHAVLFGD